MAKQLKPGQLCTINGHVLRCKQEHIDFFQSSAAQICKKCRITNNNNCIIGSILNNMPKGRFTCHELFGTFYYPILIK